MMAGIPYVIGFPPTDSLVLLTFNRSPTLTLGTTIRADLPDRDHVEAVAEQLVSATKQNEAVAAIAVVVGGTAEEHRPLITALRQGFAANDILLVHASWVHRIHHGERWQCYLDPCCAGDIPDPQTSALAVAAAIAGNPTYRTREEMAEHLAPDAPETLARREELLDAHLRTPRAPYTEDDLATDLALLTNILTDAENSPDLPTLTDRQVVRLARALSQQEVKDECLASALTPNPEAAERLWTVLVRALPAPERAEPAVLLGMSAYLRGAGTLAALAVRTALDANPSHELAKLLYAALTQATVPPNHLRTLLLRSILKNEGLPDDLPMNTPEEHTPEPAPEPTRPPAHPTPPADTTTRTSSPEPTSVPPHTTPPTTTPVPPTPATASASIPTEPEPIPAHPTPHRPTGTTRLPSYPRPITDMSEPAPPQNPTVHAAAPTPDPDSSAGPTPPNPPTDASTHLVQENEAVSLTPAAAAAEPISVSSLQSPHGVRAVQPIASVASSAGSPAQLAPATETVPVVPAAADADLPADSTGSDIPSFRGVRAVPPVGRDVERVPEAEAVPLAPAAAAAELTANPAVSSPQSPIGVRAVRPVESVACSAGSPAQLVPGAEAVPSAPAAVNAELATDAAGSSTQSSGGVRALQPVARDAESVASSAGSRAQPVPGAEVVPLVPAAALEADSAVSSTQSSGGVRAVRPVGSVACSTGSPVQLVPATEAVSSAPAAADAELATDSAVSSTQSSRGVLAVRSASRDAEPTGSALRLDLETEAVPPERTAHDAEPVTHSPASSSQPTPEVRLVARDAEPNAHSATPAIRPHPNAGTISPDSIAADAALTADSATTRPATKTQSKDQTPTPPPARPRTVSRGWAEPPTDRELNTRTAATLGLLTPARTTLDPLTAFLPPIPEPEIRARNAPG
ncbi:hypothetical protein JCM33774_62330 [Actinophytocola sp. KF-1]